MNDNFKKLFQELYAQSLIDGTHMVHIKPRGTGKTSLMTNITNGTYGIEMKNSFVDDFLTRYQNEKIIENRDNIIDDLLDEQG